MFLKEEAAKRLEDTMVEAAKPYISTAYVNVLWFLMTTMAVFLISLVIALLLLRLCSRSRRQGVRRGWGRSTSFPPSYDTVLRKEQGGLPSYSQACGQGAAILKKGAG